MTFRDTVLAEMRRTLWVLSYSNVLDSNENDDDPHDYDTEKWPSVGPGEDWFDITPEAPAEVCAELAETAESWLQTFESLNKKTLAEIFSYIGVRDEDLTTSDLWSFGYHLICHMQGNGVGLPDWAHDMKISLRDTCVPYDCTSDDLAYCVIFPDKCSCPGCNVSWPCPTEGCDGVYKPPANQ